MEKYHSTRTYKPVVPQNPDCPFVYEYRTSSSEEFVACSAIEGDRFVPTDLESAVYGYQWAMGFRVGESTLARTFMAPRAGLICIDFLDGIRYGFADREASGVQVWHNQTLLFPETGIYPDDLYPLTTETFLTLPKMYRVVEEGDTIRLIVRSLKPDNADDVICEQEISYLFGGALTHKVFIAPGKTASIPTYTTDGVIRFISRDPATVAVGVDGTVLGLSEGSGLVQLVFADGSEDWVEILVSNTPEIAENPYCLNLEESRTARSPGAGLGVSEEDTLQLCARLGQAVVSHGDRLCDATRYDRAGDRVNLLQNDVLSDTVDVTFLDSYRGGRSLSEMTLTLYADGDAGYVIRLFYSKTKAPQQFIYLTTLQNDLPFNGEQYPVLRLTPTMEEIADVHTLRAQFLRTDGKGISLCEWDVWLTDESNEVLALRNELRQSFWLPQIFADGMMFQRQKPIRVFGYSKAEGATLTLGLTDAEGKTHATTAEVTNGKFMAEFPAQEATDKGLTLTVSGLGQTTVFRDIWIGDLWIVAGQSNIGISANWISQQGYDEEFEQMQSRFDERQPIRMFTQLPQAGDCPCRDTIGGRWMNNTQENAQSFSAIGYYSVRLMQETLGIPMGIVYTALSGTWIQSWVDADFFDGSEESDRMYENWFVREKLGKEGWCRPMAPFNGMVAPLAGFAVKGVLWYQGTNNAGQRATFYNYGRQLQKFIAFWRNVFMDDKLPFVIVQMLSALCYSVPNLPEHTGGIDNPANVTDLATLFAEVKPKEPSENMFGYVMMREFQSYVEANDKNVLTVVAYDLSDKTHDIHPPNKLPLAERMGKQTLGIFYGVEGLCHSPTFASVTQTSDGLLLTFHHADGGLVVSDGKPIRHFEVSEDGYHFIDAEAELREDAVFIPSQTAKYVRHAFESCPEVNVYNQSGYPLEPFRAGVSEGRIWEGDFTVKISG